MVKVRIVNVCQNNPQDDKPPQHYVLMQDEGDNHRKIWIGLFEAWAISLALQDDPPERPMTYDVMNMILDATAARLEEAHITELRNETFYSILKLRTGATLKELDVRPSDAITLALLTKSPIFVADDVWDKCSREAE